MAEILYLNKQLVDIPSKKVTRKIQIGDIGDISSRKSTFSYSIKLPMTSRNKIVLDMLGVMGNNSRKPYEAIRADYVVDGIYLVENGFARIRATTGQYEVNIFDGVVALSEALKGKKLNGLPLSDLDHILTTQNFVNAMDRTEGYIYALGDFGLLSTNSSTVKVERQAPSIFVHTLFRKIFEAIGINLVGDFFSINEEYLSEVVTPVKGYEIEQVEDLTTTSKGGVDLDQLSDYRSGSTTYIEVREDFSLTNDGFSAGSFLTEKITFTEEGAFKFKLDLSYNTYDTYLTLYVRKNGSIVSSVSLADNSDSGAQEKVVEVVLNLSIDDEISFSIFASSSYGFDQEYYEESSNARRRDDLPRTVYYSISYSVQGSVSVDLQEGGQFISIADSLGDTGQLDFVKDIIKRYGLVLHPIQSSDNYRFSQIETILNNTGQAEDWTDKLQLIKSEKYESGYAKTNTAKFNYPDGVEVPTHDGELTIDNDNAREEKTIISSIFEIPSPSRRKIANQTVYSVPIWGFDDESEVELKETPIKVMKVKRVNTSITAKLFDETGGIQKVGETAFVIGGENVAVSSIQGDYNQSENSVAFSGTEKIVSSQSLDFTGGGTILAEIYAPSWNNNCVISNADSATPTDGFYLFLGSTGGDNRIMALRVDNSTLVYSNDLTISTQDAWINIAVTIADDGEVSFYLNGVDVGVATSSTAVGVMDSTRDIVVANLDNSGSFNRSLEGRVRRAEIYEEVLTSTGVGNWNNRAIANKGVWRFDFSVYFQLGVPFLRLDNLSLQFSIARYYKAFQLLIDPYKEVQALFQLSVIDVFNLDFFRLKYLRQTGRFYYLNSVQHTPNKVAKATMIEISQFPVNQPPQQSGGYATTMRHDTTLTITASRLLSTYFDPELDSAFKVKILNGFNNELVLRQNGVDVVSETEILVSELALTVFDQIGGLDEVVREWEFVTMDEGSKEYSDNRGVLKVTALQRQNTNPVARAGSNETRNLYPSEINYPHTVSLSGSQSYDNTGDIILFGWAIDSQPTNADVTLNHDGSSPNCSISFPNHPDSVGDYVLRLAIVDEYGATDEDTVTVTVNLGDYYGDI